MRRALAAAALVSVSIVVGSVARADDPVTEVDLLHPTGMGFTVDTDVDGDFLRAWAPMNGGDVLMFERDTSVTLPWTLQMSSTAEADELSLHAGQAGELGEKTCCEFWCSEDPWHFVQSLGTCLPHGGGCMYCRLNCSAGWINCPPRTDKVFDRR